MSFAVAYQWRKYVDRLGLIVAQNHLHHLFLGVANHLLAGHVAIGRCRTCIEQSQVVVYFGGGAHGGAWILVGGLLFYAYHGRQSSDLVNVGTLHSAQKIACIGRESFDIAALSFGKNGVESQRRLARTRQTGDNGQRVAGDCHVYVLEVVDPCPPHIYLFVLFHTI